jgi:sec-independent protein translocase protein TatA
MELVMILLIALLVFGSKRLPETVRALGRSIRELKGSLTIDESYDPGAAKTPRKDLASKAPSPRSPK